MWQDLRDSLRTLRHSPGFALTALFVLALGIGINTAIFSLIHAVLFNSPPVRAAHELRYIYRASDRGTALNYNDYRYLIDSNDVFAELVAVASDTAKIGGGGNVHRIAGESVSANYFDVLGVQSVMGRTFRAEDEQLEAARVVVISHQMWLRQFNADPAILGKTLRLTRPGLRPEDQWPDYAIVGVMGAVFKGVSSPWQPTQFWVPIVQRASDYAPRPLPPLPVYRSLPPRSWPLSLMIGRLKPAETDARAQAVVKALSEQLKRPLRTDEADWGLVVRDSRRVRLPFDPARQIVPERLAMGLMTVAGLVLLIATANLAGLLMARGVTRRSEIAVRLTLGASRWRIARQLLSEGLALALAGGAMGILLARALVVIFIDLTPAQLGRFGGGTPDIPLNLSVFLFTAGLCVVAGLLVGLAPARQASRTDLLTALGGTALHASRRTGRLRHWIVVPQVCLSLVLLLVAGTLARPLLRAELTDPGYEPDGLVFAEFDLAFMFYPDKSDSERKQLSSRRDLFYKRLIERASSLPGMAKTALAQTLPFDPMASWAIDRNAYPGGRLWWVADAAVSPGYFDVLGMSVLRGRTFDARDRKGAPPTAIVCERLAQWLWPGQNPIGQFVGRHWPQSSREPEWLEVIGVVNEVQPPLSEGAHPAIYTPLDQAEYARSIVVRGQDTPGNVERTLRQVLAESDDSVEIQRSGTVSDAIASMRYPRRMAVGILSLSGIMGLLLASMGIYGVVSYSVAQRLREIGIRAALGARQAQLIRLVILDGVKVVAVGSILGVAGAFAAFRFASKLIVALPAVDAATLLVVPVVLASVILAACYVPARRAGRVDPIAVLRNL